MFQDNLGKIKEILGKQPILAIDYALDAVSTEKQSTNDLLQPEIIELFYQAILKSQGINEESGGSKLVLALFNNELSQQKKRFIGICLLRLLNINENLFRNDTALRNKSFNLFDEVFSSDLYKQLNIDIKNQTYEKQSRLKDVVVNLEQEFSSLITSFTSLDSIRDFRHNFFQKINNRLFKAILIPFLLPELIDDVKLKEIFNSLEDYVAEQGIKKLQIFEKAHSLLADYLLVSKQHGSKYSCAYLGIFAEKAINLLETDFKNNPLSKPAKLIILKSEKKYPLSIIGAEFALDLVVKNLGPGQAFDVSLREIEVSDNIQVNDSERYLGHLELTSIPVPISCKVTRIDNQAILLGELIWKNFDKSEGKEEFCLELESQDHDIDWESLAIEEPYSLEPVITEDELVGRTEQLNGLIARAKANSVGSSYIFGQKRVGKTSVAQTLKTRLNKLIPCNYLVIYLEGGDYVHSQPSRTIENLGRKLCEKIQQIEPKFSSLQIPAFDGALAPLSDFLESVVRIVPEFRILFILDEFDELPIDIYKRSPIGDTFFLTLRSISAKPNFGFLLVAGEKMEFIISTQGDALNKFKHVRIDYFDNPQSDFKDLVRKPVVKWNIEVSDRAVYELYQQTGGNPYFTKQICGELFKLIVNRRDGHITPKEIEDATNTTLNNIASNSFLHFWEDGIFETGDRAEEISMNRRKILLSLAETSRKYFELTRERIIEQALKYGLSESTIKNELRDFERRQVLVSKDDIYDYRVPLFGRWLQEKGVNEIITTFTDLDSILQRKKQEEEAYVRSEEIVKLISHWGTYQGRSITEDKVRAWLNQFDENSDQRLMFRILENLKFYTKDNIRTKMKEAQGIIIRGGVSVRKYETEKQRKRSDILISYLDAVGKSGAEYAKLFADENEIYYGNVIERSKLNQVLKDEKKIQQIKALVFLDDFIGTGGSACKYFQELVDECGDLLRNTSFKIFLIAISGFQEAQASVEHRLSDLNLIAKVHICDPLDESAKVFSDKSRVFTNPDNLARAKFIAYQYGSNLVKFNPLGYGTCEAIVVFAESCPNNTLPILWSDSKDWIPLFKRL